MKELMTKLHLAGGHSRALVRTERHTGLTAASGNSPLEGPPRRSPAQPLAARPYPLLTHSASPGHGPLALGGAAGRRVPGEQEVPAVGVSHCGFQRGLALSNGSPGITSDAQDAFIVSKQKSKSDCDSGDTAARGSYTHHSAPGYIQQRTARALPLVRAAPVSTAHAPQGSWSEGGRIQGS